MSENRKTPSPHASGAPDARQEILRGLHPVRPLAAPWKRALVVFLPCVLAGALLVGGVSGWRADLVEIGPFFSWGVSVIFLVVAYAVAVGVVRESIPGARLPVSSWVAILALIVASQWAVSSLLHGQEPFPIPQDQDPTRLAIVCSAAISGLGLPSLICLVVLCRRGLPSRLRSLGILAGIVAVVGAESLWRLHCPFTSPGHLTAAHFPAYVVLALVGFGIMWVFRPRSKS